MLQFLIFTSILHLSIAVFSPPSLLLLHIFPFLYAKKLFLFCASRKLFIYRSATTLPLFGTKLSAYFALILTPLDPLCSLINHLHQVPIPHVLCHSSFFYHCGVLQASDVCTLFLTVHAKIQSVQLGVFIIGDSLWENAIPSTRRAPSHRSGYHQSLRTNQVLY